VYQGERRLDSLVGQVRVVPRQLLAFQQPLVHHGLAVERTDVEPVRTRRIPAFDGFLDSPPGLEEPPIEGAGRLGRPVGDHHRLFYDGFGLEGGLAEVRSIGRDPAPGADTQAVVRKNGLGYLPQSPPVAGVGREKHRSHHEVLGQVTLEFVGQELRRRLQQYSRAVARVLLGPGGAPVFQVRQQFEAVGDHVVTAPALEVHYHADPTVRPVIVRVSQRPRTGFRTGWIAHDRECEDLP